jgi:hypothetical protein
MRLKEIENVQDLKKALLEIYDDKLNTRKNERTIALALALILSELCPLDRSIKHVRQRAEQTNDKEQKKKDYSDKKEFELVIHETDQK